MMYVGGSPGYVTSPSLRRSLSFTAWSLLGQDFGPFMEGIITTGSAAAAASPGFLSQGAVEFFSQGGGEFVS